jgi:ActR/RegA family two-component response regulator
MSASERRRGSACSSRANAPDHAVIDLRLQDGKRVDVKAEALEEGSKTHKDTDNFLVTVGF